MALYVANVSKQVFQLHFWVERTSRPIVVEIPPGSQKKIYQEGARSDHENIVGQHKMYGLIPVSEIDRHKGFVGQCYQFDTPISMERLFETMTNNDDTLYEQSAERRKEAAASADDLLKRAAQETDSKVSSFEIEIEEIEQKGVDTQVHEVISMSEDEQPRRGRGRPRRN